MSCVNSKRNLITQFFIFYIHETIFDLSGTFDRRSQSNVFTLWIQIIFLYLQTSFHNMMKNFSLNLSSRERTNVRWALEISHLQHVTFVMSRLQEKNHCIESITTWDLQSEKCINLVASEWERVLHNNRIGESFQPKTLNGDEEEQKKIKKSHVFRNDLFFTFLFNLLSFASAVLKCMLVFVSFTSPVLHSIKQSVILYLCHSIFSVHS